MRVNNLEFIRFIINFLHKRESECVSLSVRSYCDNVTRFLNYGLRIVNDSFYMMTPLKEV